MGLGWNEIFIFLFFTVSDSSFFLYVNFLDLCVTQGIRITVHSPNSTEYYRNPIFNLSLFVFR